MAKENITKDMIIGELLERYPEVKPVFEKYFGDGCCTCPGSKNEDITFGSMMHNVNPDLVVDELNRSLGKKKRSGKK